jgi:ribonuclease Y
MLAEAQKQAASIRDSEAEQTAEKLQILEEELVDEIASKQDDFKIVETELEGEERSVSLEESRVAKLENEVNQLKQKLAAVKTELDERNAEIESNRQALLQQLETVAKESAKDLRQNMAVQIVEERKLESQKLLKVIVDDLETSSKRMAERFLSRSLSRYYPQFYWPKMVNVVEVPDRKIIDEIAASDEQLIKDLKEKAEIEIEILADNVEQMPLIKLAGGAGVNREAARLAMQELIGKGRGSWDKAAATYDRHRAMLEREAIRLGSVAVQEVKLNNIHPEIQKLVGYLNWRTSYRQNQWFHTVEVARLAGMIADEVGVDPDMAKRCGLLHDIGKALDYRIEGSHAVISGDYADRYGESRLICDTVMSHHNDLVIETPLAFVLKAADTLSGARPGARVNLEEGYQVRLSGIESAVRSFPGVANVAIMNGAREVHVEVNHKRVKAEDLEDLSKMIARKIEADVAFPGEIKVLVSRRFEATSVA